MAAAAVTAADVALSLCAYVQAAGPDALGVKAFKAGAALSVDGTATLGCSGEGEGKGCGARG